MAEECLGLLWLGVGDDVLELICDRGEFCAFSPPSLTAPARGYASSAVMMGRRQAPD
jgi:hypothetical protein